MFVGRNEELCLLENAVNKSGTATLVYGVRKVGKTTLIKEVMPRSKKKLLYFECEKTSLAENLKSFTEEMVRQGIIDEGISFSGFVQAFRYINSLPEEYIIVVDEYPYLKSVDKSEFVDSLFQKLADNCLSNIHLILSGSHISMMRELLTEANPMFSRFGTVIQLEEMDYAEAAAFYPECPEYDKACNYAVFGGSPYVNAQLDPSASLKENIINTVLNPNSPVRFYLENMLLSEFATKMNLEQILVAIGNGKKHYNEIESRVNKEKNGNLSRQLGILCSMNIIEKNCPINKADDAKKATYCISNNLIRFYYTYVYSGKSSLALLGGEIYYSRYIENTIGEFISRRFEGICRQYFARAVRAGKYDDVRNIGTLYYDDPVNRENGEFDVALEYSDGYGVFEAKFYKNPVELDDIHREMGQMRKIPAVNIKKTGFMAINGFSEKAPGMIYIDGKEIYSILNLKAAKQ